MPIFSRAVGIHISGISFRPQTTTWGVTSTLEIGIVLNFLSLELPILTYAELNVYRII